MLRIDRSIYEAIIVHARRDYPDEACGIVAGPEDSDRPERVLPMTNAERSPTYYKFDNDEWHRVYVEMFDRDEEAVVIYHSHTATEAYPSRTDVDRASEFGEPKAHYVIASVRDPVEVEFRSFRIVDGEIAEEDVEIV